MARGQRSQAPARNVPAVVLLGPPADGPLERPRAPSQEAGYALFFGVAPPAVQPPAAEPAGPSFADRENPERLSGDELRALAYRRGVSRSEAARLSDEKLRMQLRYLVYRQYEAA